MAWSDAARRAAAEARRRKFHTDPRSGRPVAQTVGGNLKQMEAARRQMMKLKSRKDMYQLKDPYASIRGKGEKFYGTPQVLGRVKFPARAIPNSKLWISLNPKAKR